MVLNATVEWPTMHSSAAQAATIPWLLPFRFGFIAACQSAFASRPISLGYEGVSTVSRPAR